MRDIAFHVINADSNLLNVSAMDAPGAGGAHHHYSITWPVPAPELPGQIVKVDLPFQNGTIPDNGVNGVTVEALTAVCIDRLRTFQAGDFACRENALALTKLEEALHWLNARTVDRMRRKVEGVEAK